MTALPYRPHIDGLRALAVLAVIGFHAFPEWVRGGFVGVDVFFVISGYLISGILFDALDAGRFSFRAFYARRVRRIFPALIVLLLSVFAVSALALSSHGLMQAAKHIGGAAGFVANFIFWQEAGYFDTASWTKPLLHLWSLGVEEQFYLIWPPLLFLTRRLKIPFSAVIVLVTGISFTLNMLVAQQDAIGDFYSPVTRLWELTAGGMLAFADRPQKLPSENRPSFPNLRAVAGILLIAAAVVFINKDDIYPGWWGLLPVAGTICLITAGPKAWINRRCLSHPYAVGIGLISYPLYLWHWPLLSFARIWETQTPSIAIRIFAVALSFVLAGLTYHFLEKPIRFGSRRKQVTVVLCIVMVLIGGAAWAEYRKLDTTAVFTGVIPAADPLAWPYWSDPACEKIFGVSPCETNSALPKVMILGDSHGNALFPGFAFTQPRAEVIWAGTCPPLDGITLRVSKNQAQHPCAFNDFWAADQRILQANPQIKTVIIDARWRHVITGKVANQHERELWGDVILDSGYPDEAGLSDGEKVTRGMLRTIGYLEGRKLKIIFIRATPETDPELADYCHLNARPLKDCAIPLATFLEQRKDEDAMIARIQREFPDVLFYDPKGAFCDQAQCYFVRNGQLFFRDNHHLSLAGSVYLAGKIKDWMGRGQSHSK